MKGRWVLTGLALAALGLLFLLGWSALRDPGGPASPERGVGDSEGDQARLGRGAQGLRREAREATPPASTRRDVRGRVVDARGRGVGAAVVYALPKDVLGADAIRLRTVTEEDGAFRLPPADLGGHWIGVLSGVHAVAYADGDALPEPLVIKLAPGHRLELDLAAEGGLASADVALTLRTLPDHAWAYPGPGALARVERRVELSVPGLHVIRFPTTGALEVVCDPPRLWWSPPRAETEGLPVRVQMQFAPSARVIVRVRQGSPKGPFLDRGRLSAVDLTSGVEVDHREGRGPAGRHVIQRHLRPGRYRFVFEAPGFLPWSSEPVALSPEQSEVVLRAKLVRDIDLGEVRLDGQRIHRAAWRRTGDAEGAWRAAHARQDERGVRLQGIPIGRVDLLLWQEAGDDSRVAFLDGLDVTDSIPASADPEWRAGTLVRTEGPEERECQVRHARLGLLPMYESASSVRPGAAWPSTAPGGGLVLGPYPFDDLTVTTR